MFSKGESMFALRREFNPLTTNLTKYFAVQFGKKIPVLGQPLGVKYRN